MDIDPDTWNIDPHQLENKVTPRTRAVMPVHLFGQCADMEPLWRMAERHNLIVIEDAAQALGAEYQGKRPGSLGGLGCFSFYPTKNLGAYGDAGMVVTNDAAWAARMACLRTHGMEPKYFHKYLGWNARLDAVQAAVLRVKLPHLDRWIESRRAAARHYDALLDEYHLGEFLTRPVVRSQRLHTFNQYVVRMANGQRDGLAHYLKSEGIGYEIYYPVPLHLQECLAFLGYCEGDFPASENACRSGAGAADVPGVDGGAAAPRDSDVCGLPAAALHWQHRKRIPTVCGRGSRQTSRGRQRDGECSLPRCLPLLVYLRKHSAGKRRTATRMCWRSDRN